MSSAVTLALIVLADAQRPSCNLNALVAPVNAACCPRPSACTGGVPNVCTTSCRAAWQAFSADPCRAQALGSAGTAALSGIFDQVGALCGRGDVPANPGGGCPALRAPAGTTGVCQDTNLGATCDFACVTPGDGPNGKGPPPPGGGGGHRRSLLAAHNATAPRRALQTGNVATFTCGPGRGGPQWNPTATCADGTGAAAVGIDPSDSTQFIMNNGQTMPVVSFGFEIYGNDQASLLMGIALDAGVRNFFASVLASNQPGVGAKIATMEADHGVRREEIFVCGSVTQCRTSMTDAQCYTYTADMAARNLRDLSLPYVDQIMLDYPPSSQCDANTCMLIKSQWRACTDMLERGETLSIAVSNYCPCHLDCIISDPAGLVVPVVNQLKYHVGMGGGAILTAFRLISDCF